MIVDFILKVRMIVVFYSLDQNEGRFASIVENESSSNVWCQPTTIAPSDVIWAVGMVPRIGVG